MAGVLEVDDEDFEELVLRAACPAVVHFAADWAGPSKMVDAEMRRLARKYGRYLVVAKVDVEASPRLTQMFNIVSVPTVAFLQPDRQPMGVVGFRPAEQYEEQFGLLAYLPATTARSRQPVGGAGITGDAIERLRKLAELRDAGVLAQAEFDEQKRQILGGL